MQVLVIDVKESAEDARAWADRVGFTFPMLLDADGTVSTSYAPEGVLPDIARADVPIASNLIVDETGTIQFYTLLDSQNFDAKLVQLRARLDELLEEGPKER